MHGYRFQPKADRISLRSLLNRMIVSPDHLWVPVNTRPIPVDLDNIPAWQKKFPKICLDTDLPDLNDLDRLVAKYLHMGFWDFAFQLVILAFYDSWALPSIGDVVFQGIPGASRIYLSRGGTLLAVPMSGSIRKVIESWFALSGGFLNVSRQFLAVDTQAFEAHFRSLNSPVYVLRPFDSEDPSYVLSMIRDMNKNELGYPNGVFEDELPIKHGAVWLDDYPVGYAYRATQLQLREQDPEMVKSGFLGMDWLKRTRDTIPAPLYQRAVALRERRYAHV